MNKNYQLTILHTLKEMLKVKKLDQISVADICRKSNISRQCFYYYFQDLNDCLVSLFLEEANFGDRDNGREHPTSLREVIFAVYEYIFTNREIVVNIATSPQKIFLYEKIQNTLDANLKRQLSKWVPESNLLPAEDIDYMVKFYISTLISSIYLWIDKKFATSPEFEVVHYLIVTDGMFKDWTKRFLDFHKRKGLPYEQKIQNIIG